MMPIDAIGYQQLPASDDANTSESDTETPETLDRALPHSDLPAGRRPSELNGVKRFLASDESDTDTDTNGSDADEEDTSRTPSALGKRVMCRHLALNYCLRSLDNNRHAPRSADLRHLRRESPQTLDDLRTDLACYSRALHIICARDFGVFLRQTFNDMVLEPGSATTESQRVYYISTGSHGMALRLVCRPGDSGERTEHEVSVFDPNFTDHHVQCVVDNLYAFTAHPKHHGFLSYILAREEGTDTHQRRVADYFGTKANPALQMMLYELRPGVTRQSPAALHTDWAACPRASVYLAGSAGCKTPFDNALSEVLTRAAAGPSPNLLEEIAGFDHAVLVYILSNWTGDGSLLKRWLASWQTCETALQVHLAAAYDQNARPLGFVQTDLHPQALSAWTDLLQSMAPSLALRVLSSPDASDGIALRRALLSVPVLRALDHVLRRCAAEMPQQVQALLAFEDPQGVTALGRAEPDWPPEALSIWVSWVQEWVPAEHQVALLLAPDTKGCPALIRAIESGSSQWVNAWTQVLLLVPEDMRMALLGALDNEGRPALVRAIRSGKANDVKAWAGCLSALAPAARARLLAGRDASGLPLLAQPWCDEHPVYFGKRQFVRLPERVAAQHEALRAWSDLLVEVPIDARLDMLAGASPAGEPAWIALARLELFSEVELLEGLYRRLVPDEHRGAMARRMGFGSDEALTQFLNELRLDRKVQSAILVAASLLADWIDPALQAAIQAIGEHN